MENASKEAGEREEEGGEQERPDAALESRLLHQAGYTYMNRSYIEDRLWEGKASLD